MTRTAARHIAPVLVAVALLGGCGDDSSDTASTTASPAQGQDSALCDGYAEVKTSVEELRSDPIEPTASPEEIQEKAVELSAKAATLKANLSKLSALSDGPVAAAVGEMNTKADELSESLTEAAATAQESMGPKITQAQTELNAAYDKVTTVLDERCPSS